MIIIEASDLFHSYEYEGSQSRSIDGISLLIDQGEWIAILGQNGSGKTTFAKHINALLSVQEGELTVAGLDAKDPANAWKIRQECGMVFQAVSYTHLDVYKRQARGASTKAERTLSFSTSHHLLDYSHPRTCVRVRNTQQRLCKGQ